MGQALMVDFGRFGLFFFCCLFVFCILFGNSLRTTEAQVPQFGDPGTDGTSQLPPRAGSQGQKCFDGWPFLYNKVTRLVLNSNNSCVLR